MKTAIIYLGIALMTFTNVVSALDKQQLFVKEDGVAQTAQSIASFDTNSPGTVTVEKRHTTKETPADFTPEVIAAPYQKTMEEIIAENNQITESAATPVQTDDSSDAILVEITIEGTSLHVEPAMADRVIQDSQVIESTVFSAVQPAIIGNSKRNKF